MCVCAHVLAEIIPLFVLNEWLILVVCHKTMLFGAKVQSNTHSHPNVPLAINIQSIII